MSPAPRSQDEADRAELRRLHEKLAAAEQANNHTSAAAIRAEIEKRRGYREQERGSA
jgi:hypothetical protein